MNKTTAGLSIGARLIITFISFTIIIGVSLVIVYQHYVPKLVNEQINLRAFAIAKSFSSAVLEPVMVRNYLRVNKIAEVTAQLPDVAYASVFNKRGFPIAGILGDPTRFDPNFISIVKTKGFPRDIIEQNKATVDGRARKKILTIGQKKVLDVALTSGKNGAEIHLGLFVGDIQKAVRNSLTPLLALLAAIAILGIIAVIFVGRTISRPIRQLTEQVQEVSMGNLDLQLNVKGGGEIRPLVESFRRMQTSLQFSAKQLKKRHE